MGTKEGAKKAVVSIKEKYGEDYYRKLGRKGGQLGVNGGFACLERGSDGLTGPERARILGAKGGRISKRGPARNKRVKIDVEFLHAEQAEDIEVTAI